MFAQRPLKPSARHKNRCSTQIRIGAIPTILIDSDTGEMFDDDVTVGYADRYGGSGIGLNGGSGRAAVVNGYLVKGVGRTPLVSSLTDESHASGGAYLEESIRETIFAEIVRAEFPCSAIPVLAIIDTGLIQIFEESAGPKMERRTLLIRPSFIRPAHFERATAYFSGNPKEGQQDTLRVSQFFTQVVPLVVIIIPAPFLLELVTVLH